MIYTLAKWIHWIGNKCNWISAFAIFLMMLICCLDVVCRWMGFSVAGAYEIIGLLGTVSVSMSLGYTAIERSHIAVNYILEFFPLSVQRAVEGFDYVVGCVLFALASWQSAVYAADMKQFGEVSLTLQIPLYPFIYGISIGCAVLSLVLAIRIVGVFAPSPVVEDL